MASKKFENGSVEFQWFGDFWKMVQEYWVPEDGNAYWQNLVHAGEAMHEKYKDTEMDDFTLFMITRGLYNYLEHKVRNGRS